MADASVSGRGGREKGSARREEDGGLAAYFMGNHRECDACWAQVESLLDGGEAGTAAEAWRRYDRALRRHMAIEEEILFPAFEQATGMTQGGPTFVMRSEHEQMRGVLDQIESAMQQGDAEEALDQGDTLLMLIQQHNSKEEGVLYPMSERALGGDWPSLKERIESYGEGGE